MRQILKLFILFFLLSFFQGCKKNNDDITTPKKYDSFFLNTREYMFSGALPDSSVFWKYGIYEFQRGYASIPLNNDGEHPQKSLSFDLISNKDLSTGIAITTPAYTETTGELFSSVLAQGNKEIGGKYDKFELKLTLNKTLYTTNGDQANSVLEILKTEKSKDEFNKDVVLVWFKVSCKFYSTVDTSYFTLKDGYILADFMYNL